MRQLAITYANLAVIYSQLGDIARARENGKKALDTDPQAVDQMISQLDLAITARPAAQGYLRLGILLSLTGRASQAQQAFAQARHLDPRLALPEGRPQR